MTPASIRGAELAAIALLAFTARVGVVIASGPHASSFGDAGPYIRASRALIDTGRYPSTTDLHIFRPPGYPVFLALSTAGHPESILADKLWNATSGALAAALLAALAGRICRSRGAALLAGTAAAVHPAFLLLASEVQSESLAILLLELAAFFLIVAVDRPSSNAGLLAGAFLAAAALTRPVALVLAPLLAAPAFDRRYPPGVSRTLALSALLGFAIVLGPWTIRNAIAFHAILPVNDGGAFVLYQGNSENNLLFYERRANGSLERYSGDFYAAVTRDWPGEVPELSDANPGVRARALTRAAIGWMRRHPAEELRLLRLKTLDWLRLTPDRFRWPTPAVAATAVLYGLLFAFSACGLARATRRGIALAAFAALALSMAAHVATIVAWRYRTVFWDPILIVYGGGFAAGLVRRGRDGRATPS